MVRFYNLQATPQFFQMIDSCKGAVVAQWPDGSCEDIRQNHPMRGRLANAVFPQLELRLEEPGDLRNIAYYMMGTFRNPTPHQS